MWKNIHVMVEGAENNIAVKVDLKDADDGEILREYVRRFLFEERGFRVGDRVKREDKDDEGYVLGFQEGEGGFDYVAFVLMDTNEIRAVEVHELVKVGEDKREDEDEKVEEVFEIGEWVRIGTREENGCLVAGKIIKRDGKRFLVKVSDSVMNMFDWDTHEDWVWKEDLKKVPSQPKFDGMKAKCVKKAVEYNNDLAGVDVELTSGECTLTRDVDGFYGYDGYMWVYRGTGGYYFWEEQLESADESETKGESKEKDEDESDWVSGSGGYGCDGYKENEYVEIMGYECSKPDGVPFVGKIEKVEGEGENKRYGIVFSDVVKDHWGVLSAVFWSDGKNLKKIKQPKFYKKDFRCVEDMAACGNRYAEGKIVKNCGRVCWVDENGEWVYEGTPKGEEDESDDWNVWYFWEHQLREV